MVKKVLIIAFDFPPSSAAAVQRTLKLVEYLPEFGWQSVVLTAKTCAYERTENSQLISPYLEKHLYRTTALDVKKHLSIKGKHFSWMMALDRWSTWIPTAIFKGQKLLKEYDFDAIFSTSPIPSSHIIANVLAKKSGIPWIADYRDPMLYMYYPTGKLEGFLQKWVDRLVSRHSSAMVFATSSAMDLYKSRVNEVDDPLLLTIENGYDEGNFEKLANIELCDDSIFSKSKFSLYYSGSLYQEGRDPVPLFQAIAELVVIGKISTDNFELIFQGSGDGERFWKTLIRLGLNDIIHFKEPVPYLESLANMSNADGLLLIQDAVFNLQVPGKLYEYIRAQKPILVMTPQASATSGVAHQTPYALIAYGKYEIIDKLKKIFKKNAVDGNGFKYARFSRYEKSKEFAKLFNQIAKNN